MRTHARSARPDHRSRTLRRTGGALLACAFAVLVAAGCGTGSDGDDGAAGLAGDDGPLAWLPEDTWLVGTANVGADSIDEAVQTLGRLPIWALAEGFLPARDGTGLRREALQEIARQAPGGGDDKVTAKELEEAFGDRLGFAIPSTDFEALDGDAPPVMGWIEVDDEDRAVEVARALFAGTDTEAEHEGQTYYESGKDDAITWLVRDGLLVVSSTPKRMEALIDVREGHSDDSLAGDETAAAILDAGVGDALVGVAIATDPLMDAAPELARLAATSSVEPGSGESLDGSSEREADEAEAIARKLGPVLKSKAIDGLVPDWVGGSLTIDDTGLRMRGAWSNPRELADPEPGSRELVERMPVDAPVVQAGVMSGTELGRVQDAWSEVRDAYDLDLRDLIGGNCAPKDKWSCDLATELLVMVLEDERLAEQAADAGPTVTAASMDLASVLASAIAAETGQPAPSAGDAAASFEFVTNAAAGDYAASEGLVRAARAAGLTWSVSDGSVTLRLRPGSPLARDFSSPASAEALESFSMFGLDLRALMSPRGVRISGQRVDDLFVVPLPQGATSKVVPALRGDADTIADSQTYRDVVEAVEPPEQVGAYVYVDLEAYVVGLMEAIATEAPDVERALPTVRNNLADVPGVLQWTTRDEVDGETVGVYETVVPILE